MGLLVTVSTALRAPLPVHASSSSAKAPSNAGPCLLFTSPSNDAFNTAPLGSGAYVPSLDIVAGSVLPRPGDPGGFVARIQVLDMSYSVPTGDQSLFLSFHWGYSNPQNPAFYAGVRIPSQVVGASTDSADFEIGTWDSATDTYTKVGSSTGKIATGPNGTLDVAVPSGATPIGTQAHPVTGDVLQNVFAASYVEQVAYGRTLIDRGPKDPTTAVASYSVGGTCPHRPAPVSVTWRWSTGAPSPRTHSNVAYDETRQSLVVFSGQTFLGGSLALQNPMPLPADTYVFNGVSWHRAYPAHSPPARKDGAMVFDGQTGTVLLFGGEDTDANLLQDTWSWNGTDWTLLAPAHIPPARSSAAVAYDSARQQVVLYGGYGTTHSIHFEDTWTWNGGDWMRQPAVGPPVGASARMAYDAADGMAVLFGSGSQNPPTSYTWTWDGAKWLPQNLNATFPPARSGFSMAYDAAHQQVVLAGGPQQTDTWTWTLAAGWHEVTGAQIGYRDGLEMSYDTARHIVLGFGGEIITSDQKGTLLQGLDSHTVAFDGKTWQTLPKNEPSNRYKAAFAWDPALGEFVLFGGVSILGPYLRDTWVFDGVHWKQLTTAHSPPPLYAASMAWDGTSNKIILFGGASSDPGLGTWLFDGRDWRQAAPTQQPPMRTDAAFVWDPLTRSDLLFSGAGDGVTNDTWTWANGAWTQLLPAHAPDARNSPGIAYDPNSGLVILFSGSGGLRCVTDYLHNLYCTSTAPDTWSWNGNDWTQLPVPVFPQGREMPRMAYDAQLGGVVMTTGYAGGLATNDTWLFRDGAWQQLAPQISPDLQYGGSLATGGDGAVYLLGGAYASDVWVLQAGEGPASNVPEAPLVPLLVTGGIAVALLGRSRRRRR